MLRSKILLIAVSFLPACAIPYARTANETRIVHYITVPNMKTGVTPAGVTRVPENANSGQKLYLNPINDAMMLCALVDEVNDTCLRFYRN